MSPSSLTSSTTFKLFVLGLLSLLLLIPLSLVYGLVQERAQLAQQAEGRIAAGWGREQTVLLPLLRLSYARNRIKDGETVREHVEQLLSPTDAKIKATLAVQTRALGIYSLPIYSAQIKIEGHYLPPALSDESDADGWRLGRVDLAFAPGDLTGLREIRSFRLGTQDLGLKPTAERWSVNFATDEYGSVARPVLGADLDWRTLAAGSLPFTVDMELAGARVLQFIPNAAQFELTLAGDWPHPGFAGGMLPRQREVSASGFSADWRLLDLSTGMPASISSADSLSGWSAQAVGVALVEPGGLYQQNERSAKYGILVLALTLAALFLTEVLLGVRLHPFHYALVGLALAVFYLLLLALSEHLGFVRAYLSSGGIVVLMVGGYSAAVMRGWARGALSATLLALLYGFLLVLIRAEELSLLLGALGLTALLAVAMYLTRRFDWYSAAPSNQPQDHGITP